MREPGSAVPFVTKASAGGVDVTSIPWCRRDRHGATTILGEVAHTGTIARGDSQNHSHGLVRRAAGPLEPEWRTIHAQLGLAGPSTRFKSGSAAP